MAPSASETQLADAAAVAAAPQHPPGTDAHAIIDARGVNLSYGETRAVIDVDFALAPGESVALMGASGCGKSSLLHLLAGVLTPDSGQIVTCRAPLHAMSQSARSEHRLAHIGMVFQFGGLVSELTLRENVMLPLQLLGDSARSARGQAEQVLAELGIAEVAGQRAGAVSGGQAQRAAVARALVHRPKLIIADEPTGSLDSVNSDQVMDTFADAALALGAALLVATHDNRVASHCGRLVTMQDGRITGPPPEKVLASDTTARHRATS